MNTARNLWPISIIVFCSLFFAGTVGLIVMACSQREDLVSADYYEQELKYQGRIDSAERARHEASQAAVAYDAAHQQITVSLPPGQAQGNVSGTIQLYRPSAADLDRSVKFTPDASGVQHLDTTSMAPGLWKVRVSWTSAERTYYVEQKMVVSAKSS
jgi:hypothetical protein